MEFDTGFNGPLKNGTRPKCCWCSARIDPTIMNITWFWFTSGLKIYFAHTECGQNNMDADEAEDFADWLQEERKGPDEDLYSPSF